MSIKNEYVIIDNRTNYKTVWKKEYENKDEYHGVIRIKVRRSINMLREIYGFIEG